MSKTNDGDPAFGSGDATHGGFVGMSLRDYFAGQALAGIYANDGSSVYSTSELAFITYSQADAMLAQRKWGGDE